MRENRDIQQRKLFVMNWGSNEYNGIIDLKPLTLFVGNTGSGKSTTIDAYTYLLTANKTFNNTNEGGKGTVARKLGDYLHGYINAEDSETGEAIYLRDGAVNTHIAIEGIIPARNPSSKDIPFVAGVCIESPDRNKINPYWYVLENTTFDDIIYFYENEEGIKPCNITAKDDNPPILVKNKPISKENIETSTARGPAQVLRALGIKEDINIFRKRLIGLLTAKIGKDDNITINDFIKYNIFDAEPVEALEQLKLLQDALNKSETALGEAQECKKKLEEIETQTNKFEESKYKLNRCRKAKEYQDVVIKKQQLDTTSHDIEKVQSQLKGHQNNLKYLKKDRDKARQEYEKLINEPEYIEFTKRKSQLDSKKLELLDKIDSLKPNLKALAELEARFSGNLSFCFDNIKMSDEQISRLKNISSPENYEEKEAAFLDFVSKIEPYRETLISDRIELESEQLTLNEQISEISRKINELESNKMSIPKKYEKYRTMIQEKIFEETGERTQIYTLSELVISLTDESWRMAIESYLKSNRYTFIVEKKHLKRAYMICKNIVPPIYDIQIAQWDILPKSDDITGYASSILNIKHEGARRYADFILYNLKLYENEDTEDWRKAVIKGGIRRDGFLAKSGSIKLMSPVRDVCLGAAAVKIQLKNCLKDREKLQKQSSEISEKIKKINDRLDRIKESHVLKENFFNLRASYEYETASREKKEIEQEIRRISAGKETYTGIIQKAEDKYRDKEDAYNGCQNTIGRYENQLLSLEEQKKNQTNDYQTIICIYETNKKRYTSEYIDAENWYTKQRKTNRLIDDSDINRLNNEYNNALYNMSQTQNEYNHYVDYISDRQRCGESAIPFFRREYDTFRNTRLQEAAEAVNHNKEKIKRCFFQDYLYQINEAISKAERCRRDMNQALKNNPFGKEIYEFSMIPKEKYKVFFDIMKKMDSTHPVGETAGELTKFMADIDNDDEDMKLLLNKIIENDNPTEFTDYRNFFDYDLAIHDTDSDGRKITKRYGKRHGALSGGEKDTPAYVILIASLIRSYSHNENCARIALIDEAFSRIDKERLVQLVDYIKNLNMQIIFCVPDKEISNIGPFCDSTYGFRKKNNRTVVNGGTFDDYLESTAYN